MMLVAAWATSSWAGDLLPMPNPEPQAEAFLPGGAVEEGPVSLSEEERAVVEHLEFLEMMELLEHLEVLQNWDVVSSPMPGEEDPSEAYDVEPSYGDAVPR